VRERQRIVHHQTLHRGLLLYDVAGPNYNLP
jgi:hypothetical protein